MEAQDLLKRIKKAKKKQKKKKKKMNTQAQILFTSDGQKKVDEFELVNPMKNITSVGGVSVNVTLHEGGTSDVLHQTFTLVSPQKLTYVDVNPVQNLSSVSEYDTHITFDFSDLENVTLSAEQLTNHCNGIVKATKLSRFTFFDRPSGLASPTRQLDIVYPLFLYDENSDRITLSLLKVSLAAVNANENATDDISDFIAKHTIKKYPVIESIIDKIEINMDENLIREISDNADESTTTQNPGPAHFVSSYISSSYAGLNRSYLLFSDDIYRVFGISDSQLTNFDTIPTRVYKQTNATYVYHADEKYRGYKLVVVEGIDPPIFVENEYGNFSKFVLFNDGARNLLAFPVFNAMTSVYSRTSEGTDFTASVILTFSDAPRLKSGIDFLYVSLTEPKCKDDTYFFSNISFLSEEKILFVIDLRENKTNSHTVLSSLQMLNVSIIEPGEVSSFKFGYTAYSGVFGGYRNVNIAGVSMILKPSFLN